MKSLIDRILLAILWLLAVLLGVSFWLSIAYGFNSFSLSHWKHLSYLQATHLPVKISFYISLIIAIFVAAIGLYLLLRPRSKKAESLGIEIGEKGGSKSAFTNTYGKKFSSSANPNLSVSSGVSNPQQNGERQFSSLSRPPQLILPTPNILRAGTTSKSKLWEPASAPLQPSVPQQDYPELKKIFTDAGYTVKKSPTINGTKIALFAIGPEETLWIGSVGIKTTDIRNAIDFLLKTWYSFMDESDGSPPEINGFSVAAPDAATSEFQDILMFPSISDLRDYIKGHPSPPLSDPEYFKLFSDFIDSLLAYISRQRMP